LINADLTKLEVVIGGLVYWLVMLIVLHTTVSILGLEPLSQVLNTLLSYIPNVVSAILVLFFGVLLAGLVESLVKGAIRSIDGKAARLFGKITSYLVMSIAVLAAVSELGIARDFITILFVGFVATISVGLGLALGLGGQHVVRAMLDDWYQRVKKEVKGK
jgi:Na+/phosphate symporter